MLSPIDALRATPLAAELTADEVATLARIVHVRELKDGEILVAEGAKDSKLHVVLSGRIDVVRDGEHGRHVLQTLRTGDLVGELSFMEDSPRFAGLLASGATEVLALDRVDFETLIERAPRVVYKVMRAIMHGARNVQRRLSLQARDLENYLYRTGGKY
jgi:CRP-like cAMP-binding protein